MLRKTLKGMVVMAVLVTIITFGIYTYLQSTTTLEYGQIPEDAIPTKFDKVIYTIPTVDEQGKHGKQTFTVNNENGSGKIVKLAVRNDKVKKHEFIKQEEVPDKIKKNMQIEHF